jgi:predicted alpha/beta-fold hydrolase
MIVRDRHFQYYKDSAHYLQGDYLKGSQEEINVKFENWLSRNQNAKAKKIERVRELITDSVNKQRYIIWDAETDTSTLIHQPNLIVVNVLETDATNNYDRSLVASLKFEGYNCCDEFCNWLFSKQNANSIIIAHNGSGYDYKFVLKWCISKSLRPDTYICQGSHITLNEVLKSII